MFLGSYRKERVGCFNTSFIYLIDQDSKVCNCKQEWYEKTQQKQFCCRDLFFFIAPQNAFIFIAVHLDL